MAMTNLYRPVVYSGGTTAFLGLDGQTTTAAGAAYAITCSAGTNFLTGSGVAQVYLALSWPPQMNPGKTATGRYELITEIPLR